MQCPKCHYEPTMAEMQQSPGCCPSCGVYYSKVAAQPAMAAAAIPAPAPKVTFAQWANSNPAVKWIAALVVGLVVGYFAGREHVKYEIRSAMAESLAGLGSLFAGDSKPAASGNKPKPPAPAPKAAPKDAPITAQLVRKGFVEGKYGQSQITTDFVFTNQGPADIRAFDGVILVTDLLGNEIIRINMAVNELVAKGAPLVWSGGIDYNQFLDRHQRFRNEPQENLKISFEVKKVLYVDGRLEQF